MVRQWWIIRKSVGNPRKPAAELSGGSKIFFFWKKSPLIKIHHWRTTRYIIMAYACGILMHIQNNLISCSIMHVSVYSSFCIYRQNIAGLKNSNLWLIDLGKQPLTITCSMNYILVIYRKKSIVWANLLINLLYSSHHFKFILNKKRQNTFPICSDIIKEI